MLNRELFNMPSSNGSSEQATQNPVLSDNMWETLVSCTEKHLEIDALVWIFIPNTVRFTSQILVQILRAEMSQGM